MPVERAAPLRDILATAPSEIEEAMNPDVVPFDDGSVVVDLHPEEAQKAALEEEATEHASNLVGIISPDKLAELGNKVVKDTKDDLDSRDEWENLIANGLSEQIGRAHV